MADAKTGPRVPESFWQHVRSLGPGLMVALTWLGARDLVDSAVAGGNYGYALMWAMALALFVRFVFVSIVTRPLLITVACIAPIMLALDQLPCSFPCQKRQETKSSTSGRRELERQ